MDSIYWKCVHHNGIENEESLMIEKLCLILKYTLDSSGNLATLKDEIDYAKLYLEVQRMRKEIELMVEWNIPEEILMFTTEKLITQPILENCIQHGIEPGSKRKLKIRVNSRIDKRDIYLSFEDNGKGMTDDNLERLDKRLRDNKLRRSGHIGLANINRRLKLQYGDDYGVYLSHSDLGGLRVELKLRYEKNDIVNVKNN
jgi:two-component system sensor histidine kinase YesM